MAIVVALPLLTMFLYRVGVPALSMMQSTSIDHNPKSVWSYFDHRSAEDYIDTLFPALILAPLTDLYQRMLFSINEIGPYVGFGVLQLATFFITLWFCFTFSEPQRGLVKVAQLQVFNEVLHLSLLVFYSQVSENFKIALPGNHFFRACRGI